MQRPKVGLLGLMLELYDLRPELKPTMARFADELVASLAPYADVDFPGVCNTREQVDRAVAAFEADGKDLILVVLLTYAPSHIALPALLRTRLPFVIYNTQQLAAITAETTSSETTENHGMHGVQDLANVLLRAGKTVRIVTGHYQDPAPLEAVGAWCRAARGGSIHPTDEDRTDGLLDGGHGRLRDRRDGAPGPGRDQRCTIWR